MEKMNPMELIEFDEIKRRYDRDRNFLLQSGYDKNYIYEELSRLYPDHPGFLQNDEFFNEPGLRVHKKTRRASKSMTRSMTSRPRCIETENSICMPGLLSRYSINNYDVLDRNFEEVYRLIWEKLTSITSDSPHRLSDPYEMPPDPIIIEPTGLITMGMFIITVKQNFIEFEKVEWDDLRGTNGTVNLDIASFDELMDIPLFQQYMQLYITKILQDRYVFTRKNPDKKFCVYLDFYYNRPLSRSDQFHQDNDNFIKIDYFTLTYIVPPEKVILGASVLIQPDTPIGIKGRLQKGKYAALSVAVKNLTTLGITNTDKIFHSTPAAISSRTFGDKGFIPSTISQTRMGMLEEYIINPDTFEYENKEDPDIDIELVPLQLDPLPEHEMSPIIEVINDTVSTRRTFLRCGFAQYIKEYPDDFSQYYRFHIDTDALYDEISSIEDITLDTFFEHVLGGRKTRRTKIKTSKKINITGLKKLLRNPNRNIRVKT